MAREVLNDNAILYHFLEFSLFRQRLHRSDQQQLWLHHLWTKSYRWLDRFHYRLLVYLQKKRQVPRSHLFVIRKYLWPVRVFQKLVLLKPFSSGSTYVWISDVLTHEWRILLYCSSNRKTVSLKLQKKQIHRYTIHFTIACHEVVFRNLIYLLY